MDCEKPEDIEENVMKLLLNGASRLQWHFSSTQRAQSCKRSCGTMSLLIVHVLRQHASDPNSAWMVAGTIGS